MREECFDCREYTDLTCDYPYCGNDVCSDCIEKCGNPDCKTQLCSECINKPIHPKEWLEIEAKCENCSVKICSECPRFCYSCANEGEPFKVLCPKCSNVTSTGCKYHAWYNCEKHVKDGCGECSANRNFSARYE